MRQHYLDLYPRPIDRSDRIVVLGIGAIAGAVWLAWIVEGLLQ